MALGSENEASGKDEVEFRIASAKLHPNTVIFGNRPTQHEWFVPRDEVSPPVCMEKPK